MVKLKKFLNSCLSKNENRWNLQNYCWKCLGWLFLMVRPGNPVINKQYFKRIHKNVMFHFFMNLWTLNPTNLKPFEYLLEIWQPCQAKSKLTVIFAFPITDLQARRKCVYVSGLTFGTFFGKEVFDRSGGGWRRRISMFI